MSNQETREFVPAEVEGIVNTEEALPPNALELSEDDKQWLTTTVDALLDSPDVQGVMTRIGDQGLVASIHNKLGYGVIFVPAQGVPSVFGIIQQLLYGNTDALKPIE